MTAGQTVSDFVKLAREAVLAKDFDLAETYKQQAIAIKGLDDLAPTVDKARRLDMGSGEQDDAALEKTANSAAMKAWYTQSTGGKDIDGDLDQVLTDMYGNYRQLRWAKAADFVRFVRSGRSDPKLEKLVVYTPDQVMMELAGGMTVADLKAAMKATQLESQDTSGELTLAA